MVGHGEKELTEGSREVHVVVRVVTAGGKRAGHPGWEQGRARKIFVRAPSGQITRGRLEMKRPPYVIWTLSAYLEGETGKRFSPPVF